MPLLRRRLAREVNRALHEARRPLQFLALDPYPPREVAAIADALDQIDAVVNGKARPRAVPAEIGRLRLVAAIENIVVNALEHGEGPVEIQVVPGATSDAGASVSVRNGTRAGPTRVRRGQDPRRGHGLAVIEREADRAGDRFAFHLGDRQAVATLALGPGRSARAEG